MGRYSDGTYYADSNTPGYSGNGGQRLYGASEATPDDMGLSEEEKMRLQLQLQQTGKDMDLARSERSMRQGYYDSPQQMVGDQFSPLYDREKAPGQIQFDEVMPSGERREGRHPFMQNTIAPDATRRLGLFNQAQTRTTGMSPEQIKAREDAKLAAKLAFLEQNTRSRIAIEDRRAQVDNIGDRANMLSKAAPSKQVPTIANDSATSLSKVLASPVDMGVQPSPYAGNALDAPANAGEFSGSGVDPALAEKVAKYKALYPDKSEAQIIAAIKRSGG
jgi:hypothetical protein